MREIKFKAKRLDTGEWVEGSLIIMNIEAHLGCIEVVTIQIDDGSKHWQNYKVDPATVCQFTGLKDKNGKDIFEGDKLNRIAGEPYIVVWVENDASFSMFNGTSYISLMAFEKEVIGNVHDKEGGE